MEKQTLWTKNFCLLTFASILGAVGGIAGGYAMGFLVYDETGSTLATGLLVAIRVIPQFLLPILIAPWMDRLPRKPFLVYGDFLAGILYALCGLYLSKYPFSYIGYLVFSLVLSSIGAMDSLAYSSIYPQVIPKGFEEKGYSFSGMLYPVMSVLIMPAAALLMDTIGTANVLLIQSVLSIVAAILENAISIAPDKQETRKIQTISQWYHDLLDGFRYIKGERGLLSIYAYMAVTNGAATGYGPVLTAFFRTAPGYTAMMYSLFSVAEFTGRTLGGIIHYHVKIPEKKRFGFAFVVYQVYEWLDAILLWIPYPLMLVNRGICGFLGINSATLREAAVQRYIPDEYRARVNAFQEATISAVGSVLAVAVGSLGEVLGNRGALTVTALFCILFCWLTIWRNRAEVNKVYEATK